jgi:hypothetical protein
MPSITKQEEKMRLIFKILAVLIASSLTAAAATHPYQGQTLNQVAGYPDQATPAWNYGELTFLGPDKLPKVTELTNAERYIVAGTSTSPFSARAGLPSWQMSIWNAVARIYSETGKVPAQLTPAVLKASKFYKNTSDAELEVFRSPITGDWPYLNSKQFSAGNVYIHPLTRDEMQHFAARSPIYHKLWFEGLGPNRSKLNSKGGTIEEIYSAPYQLDGPVWYVRIYGQNKVLINTLTYAGHEK